MRKQISSWVLALTLVLSVATCTPQFLVHAQNAQQGKPTQPVGPEPDKVKAVADKAAALVTEFDVNGLKVLVKRRAGSLTVATGLFLRGGARNVTTQNAGIEALMWDAATESSQQ